MTSLERRRSTLSLILLVVSVVAKLHDVSATASGNRADSEGENAQQGIRYKSEDGSGTRHARSNSQDELIDSSDSTTPDEESYMDTAEKRKWEKNTVRVWGKRDNVDKLMSNMVDDELAKAKENRDVWENIQVGHSDNGRWNIQNGDNDQHRAKSGKRKWSNNKVRVWGKRSTKDDSLSSMIVSADYGAKPLSEAVGTRHAKTTSGVYQGAAKPRVSRSTDWEDEETIRRNVENMRRALEQNGLGWVSEDDPVLSETPSRDDQEYRSTTKRAASVRYAGGPASKAGHFPFYSADGPKRSWRTNVIRVWGK